MYNISAGVMFFLSCKSARNIVILTRYQDIGILMRQLLIFAFFCVFYACSQDKDNAVREQVIQEKVEERVERYKIEKLNSCRQKVLKRAGAIVDSILLVEARLKRDTLGKPPIPDKPVLPEIVPIKDTLPIRPFFRDSTLNLIEQDSSGNHYRW